MAEKMKAIRLKAREERRFRQGHPWVFSNELQEVPKSITSGEVVSLHDAGGGFLAHGFFNSVSLISFRELTRNPEEPGIAPEGCSEEFFFNRFNQAERYRNSWFDSSQSYRLVYGEADGLPGLVIDRFSGDEGTVFVVQPHSAGMDRSLSAILGALRRLSTGDADSGPIRAVLRRDASSREKEGLKREPVVAVDLEDGREIADLDPLRNFRFRVPGVMGTTIALSADLGGGQKTGFFFDQLQNIRLLETILLRKLRHEKRAGEGIRVLDLCSYVGQWGTHLLQVFRERSVHPVSITCVDASEPALRFAEKNIREAGARLGIGRELTVESLKADVLEPMPSIEEASYDVVVADPPAFIKNRKSVPQGKQAYAQLFLAAIRRVKPGGLVVCCSCSQLLGHEDFLEVLGKATRRSGRRVRWIAQGSPSFDHFQRLEFHEGLYLKCFIGQVD
jgi:23S rRNA (cytosine1962-C5)-methyltransferase